MARVLSQQEQQQYIQGGQPAPKEGLAAILGGITDPISRLGRGVASLPSIFMGGQNNFLTGNEIEKYKNPLNIAKDVASVGSLAIPGAGIGRAVLTGAAAGFGSTYGDDNATLTGTLTGGLTGGALGLGGKAISGLAKGKMPKFLQGAGKKLTDFADNQEVGAIQRNLGNVKVPPKLGGQKLIPEIKRLGFDTADPDALVASAENFLKQNGSTIRDRARELATKGTSVDVNDLVAPLQAKLSKTNSASLRKPIEEAIEEIKAVGGKTGKIDAEKFYNLKQELGELGKFNPVSDPAATSKANAFQDAYKQSNKLLDQIFSAAGFDDLKVLNKDLSAAIKAKNYGEIAAGRAMPGRPVNLLDAVTAAGGMAAGGPMGFAASVAGSKVLQSPKTEQMLINGARGLGNRMQGLDVSPMMGKIGEGADKIGSFMQNPKLAAILAPMMKGAGQAAPAFAQGPDQEMDPMAMADVNQMSLSGNDEAGDIARQLANSGMKPSEIKTLQDIGAIPKPKADKSDKSKLTEGEKKFSAAGQQAEGALKLLESGQVSTGLLPSIGNKVSGFFDAQSPTQTDYLSKLAAARGSAVSALSGANVPESEYARIAALIPEENDEPKKAAQKLRSFIEAMKVYSSQ